MHKLLFILFFIHISIYAKGTTAGTLIQNVATLDFELDDKKSHVQSNIVSDVVAQLLDLSLDSISLSPLQITNKNNVPILKFKLTNTGNGNDKFKIEFRTTQKSDFNMENIQIAIDKNYNQKYDQNDQISDQILLKEDEEIVIFVIANFSDIPKNINHSLQSIIELKASSLIGGSGIRGKIYPKKGVGGVDAIDGDQGAIDTAKGIWEYINKQQLIITQTATIEDPYGTHEPIKDAIINYDIKIHSIANKKIHNIHFKNPIPKHTTYVKCSIFYENRPLSDSSDEDFGEFNTKDNLIKVDINHIHPNQTKHINFKVKIK